MTKTGFEYDVSRETLATLKAYEASLHEWQKKFNLVSSSSLEDAWVRHFLDSMQLFSLLPSGAKTLMDLGSGAGFPGMVLAIMAKDKTLSLKVSLVESTAKKTLYLKHVAELANIDVEIINDRIEKIAPRKVDVITSRALASLATLLNLSQRFFNNNTKALFLKGRSYQEEIAEAKKTWLFDCEVVPGTGSSDGVVLIITNLRRK